MSKIKIQVLTPGLFKSPAAVQMFSTSCQIHNISPIYYSLGEDYVMWAILKIIKQLPALHELERMGNTHVLYTDSRDAFFIRGMEYIQHAYETLGSPPMLASAEILCNPPNEEMVPTFSIGNKPYRFPCVGGYIAEIPWLISKFNRMVTMIDPEHPGDDAELWQIGCRDGWFCPQVDDFCHIFQTEHLSKLAYRKGVVNNLDTLSSPAILHVNGGFSDPVSGKYDRMLPYWSVIYPDHPLTKEECSAY